MVEVLESALRAKRKADSQREAALASLASRRHGDGAIRILRRPEVEEITGLSRSAIYAAMDRDEFPRPIRLTAKAVGWKLSSVESWIASRELASTGDVA